MAEHDAGRDGAHGAGPTPGERRPDAGPSGPAAAGRLSQAPSARYATPAPSRDPGMARRSALPGPLARAVLAGVAGAIVLTVTGAILTSTAGLLFVAGVTGAAVGLVLSRAAVPVMTLGAEVVPVARRRVAWLSVAVALGAVVVASLATWAIGRTEGGVLGPIDYLLETFGPFIPGEALLAALGAWWGATTGPVQS